MSVTKKRNNEPGTKSGGEGIVSKRKKISEWSALSLEHREKRYKTNTDLVANIVRHRGSLEDVLAAAQGCIFNHLARTAADTDELLEQCGFATPDDVPECWREDAYGILNEHQECPENFVEQSLSDESLHSIPDLLTALLFNDFEGHLKSEYARIAIQNGPEALYEFVDKLVCGHALWWLTIREPDTPMMEHLDRAFERKRLAVLGYVDEDFGIDLRFRLEQVLAPMMTKTKITWTCDERLQSFWSSHLPLWEKRDCGNGSPRLTIFEDFCAGISMDTFQCNVDKQQNRLIVFASGRMMSMSAYAHCLTKVSEGGHVGLEVATPDGTCRKVSIHQIVGMVAHGLNNETRSSLYGESFITIDHIARDTGYFDMFSLVFATMEEEMLNKTFLSASRGSNRFTESIEGICNPESCSDWIACKRRLQRPTMRSLSEHKIVQKTLTVELVEIPGLAYSPESKCLRKFSNEKQKFLYWHLGDLLKVNFPEHASYTYRYPKYGNSPVHHIVSDTLRGESEVMLVGQIREPDNENAASCFHIFVVDHVESPTNAASVQTLTMQQNTIKECGRSVSLSLLKRPLDTDDGSSSESYVTITSSTVKKMSGLIQGHFSSDVFEDDRTASFIAKAKHSTIERWIGASKEIPQHLAKYIIFNKDAIGAVASSLLPVYRIRFVLEVGGEVKTKYVRGAHAMNEFLESDLGIVFRDHQYESARLFRNHKHLMEQVLLHITGNKVFEISHPFDSYLSDVFNTYIVTYGNVSAEVKGYEGILDFVLRHKQDLGSNYKDQHTWYYSFHACLQRGRSFLGFTMSHKKKIIRPQTTYKLSYGGETVELVGQERLVEFLQANVHEEMTYDHFCTLQKEEEIEEKLEEVTQKNTKKKCREDIAHKWDASGILVLDGYKKQKNKGNRQREQQSKQDLYFFIAAGWFDQKQEILNTQYNGRMVDAVEYEKWTAVPNDVKREVDAGALKIVAFPGREDAAGFVKHFFDNDKVVQACVQQKQDGSYETRNAQLQSSTGPVRHVLSKRTVYRASNTSNALNVTFTYRAYVIRIATEYTSIDDDALKNAIDGFLRSKLWGHGNTSSAISEVLREADTWSTFQCKTTQYDVTNKTSNSHRAQFAKRLRSQLHLSRDNHNSGLGHLKTGKGDLAWRCRRGEGNAMTLEADVKQLSKKDPLFPFWYRHMTKHHLPGEKDTSSVFCVTIFAEDIKKVTA